MKKFWNWARDETSGIQVTSVSLVMADSKLPGLPS